MGPDLDDQHLGWRDNDSGVLKIFPQGLLPTPMSLTTCLLHSVGALPSQFREGFARNTLGSSWTMLPEPGRNAIVSLHPHNSARLRGPNF